MDQIDRLLANIKKNPPAAKPAAPQVGNLPSASIDSLLASLADRPAVAKPQPTGPSDDVIKQQRQQQLTQRRHAALEQRAKLWLQTTLDRTTPEGKWFEEFSCSYTSDLAAAIAYLAAIDEVDGIVG
jgi:hypothetical protein